VYSKELEVAVSSRCCPD